MQIKIKTPPDTTTKWKELSVGQLFEDQNGDVMMVVRCNSFPNNKCLVHWVSYLGPSLAIRNGHFETSTKVQRLLSPEDVEIT